MALTLSFASCGGSEKKVSTSSELSSPATAVSDDQNLEHEKTAVIKQSGMVRLIASHYQSCAPLLRPGKKPKNIIAKYFDERTSYANKSYCEDRRSANLDYVSFSKGSFEPNAGRLAPKNGMINAFQRFNCSGFVAATMSADGLKYYESQESKFYSPRTSDIISDFKRKDSCFYKPRISRKVSIKAGDIINVSHAHVIRILKVGEDPLGLSNINEKAKCKDISRKNFNFIFAHSTSNNKTPGRNGVLVEKAAQSSTKLVKRLEDLVKDLCFKKFNNGKFSGQIKDKKIGSTDGFLGFGRQDKIFSLRRHFGLSKPECTFVPPSVVGSQCIMQGCFERF